MKLCWTKSKQKSYLPLTTIVVLLVSIHKSKCCAAALWLALHGSNKSPVEIWHRMQDRIPVKRTFENSALHVGNNKSDHDPLSPDWTIQRHPDRAPNGRPQAASHRCVPNACGRECSQSADTWAWRVVNAWRGLIAPAQRFLKDYYIRHFPCCMSLQRMPWCKAWAKKAQTTRASAVISHPSSTQAQPAMVAIAGPR